MAFKISYNSFPDTIDPSSVGYIHKKTTFFDTLYNNKWQSTPLDSILSPGVYNVSSNISFKNSPNSFSYIILDTSFNGSIWYDSGKDAKIFSTFNSYHDALGTAPLDPSVDANYANGSVFKNWYPVAGQQMRNGVSGSSCELSLSCNIYVRTPTKVACISWVQPSTQTCTTLTCMRIA